MGFSVPGTAGMGTYVCGEQPKSNTRYTNWRSQNNPFYGQRCLVPSGTVATIEAVVTVVLVVARLEPSLCFSLSFVLTWLH